MSNPKLTINPIRDTFVFVDEVISIPLSQTNNYANGNYVWSTNTSGATISGNILAYSSNTIGVKNISVSITETVTNTTTNSSFNIDVLHHPAVISDVTFEYDTTITSPTYIQDRIKKINIAYSRNYNSKSVNVYINNTAELQNIDISSSNAIDNNNNILIGDRDGSIFSHTFLTEAKTVKENGTTCEHSDIVGSTGSYYSYDVYSIQEERDQYKANDATYTFSIKITDDMGSVLYDKSVSVNLPQVFTYSILKKTNKTLLKRRDC